MSCKCKKEVSCKKACQCNKCNKCNHCKCNCSNRWQWVKFPTCRDKNTNDVYEFLGKFVYDLLADMDLPCGHPGIREIIRILENGGRLPCGHPGLEELILMAILEDNKELCKTAKKICCKK
ncbi:MULTISPECIES: hypothetical protein [Paraclostridium]|uniref:hypothetical protein n=1 Tax=Paraclostridium TaxID=1849822 RepID=UPI00051DDABF|nr:MULTISPECIES: hypothetical protein [Paraclostridium]KGJ49950.1 hypothetical protein KD33_03080 [Clostridium sp. NCR]MCU9813099.1 hypothetical protein [Paraclostridium sp. AKS81]